MTDVELYGKVAATKVYDLGLLFVGHNLYYQSKKGLLEVEITGINVVAPYRPYQKGDTEYTTVDVVHKKSGKTAKFSLKDLLTYVSLYDKETIRQLYQLHSIVQDRGFVPYWAYAERILQDSAL